MDLYHFVLFLHILGVLGLFAAITLQHAFLTGIRTASSVSQVRAWSQLVPVIERSHPITSPLILLSGLYLTIASWGFQTAWIDASILVLIAMAIVGVRLVAPRFQAIHHAADAASEGPIPDALAREIGDPGVKSTVRSQSAIAIGLIFLMTNKPDLIGTIVVLVVAVVLGVLWGRMGSPAMAASSQRRSTTG
jgi:hypothetical protein